MGIIKLHKYDKRFYYKLEILYNKYAPFFVAFVITVDNYLDLQNKFIHSLTYLCIPSVLTLGHMYISRNVLRLCRLHRIVVDYILFNILFRIWQAVPFLPNGDRVTWHIIYTVTFISVVSTFLYNYASNNKKIITSDNK